MFLFMKVEVRDYLHYFALRIYYVLSCQVKVDLPFNFRVNDIIILNFGSL